jgi:hypothetical protein
MLTFLLAAALALPPRVAEVPVSAGVMGRAPLSQYGQRIGSNGSLALCAWNDNHGVVASRIDANGTPLDIPGIVVAESGLVADVFWNGDAFVVVATAISTEFVFVRADGTIANRVTALSELGVYAANTNQGAATRVLLLPFDGWTPNATLLDANARVVKKGSNAFGGTSALAAWNGESFLVVRNVNLPQTPYHLSERIDREGNVLSSETTGVPFSFSQDLVLAGDARGGFVLFDGRTMYRLDGRGVATGSPTALQSPQPLESSVTRLFATMTDDGFVASWAVNLTNGRALTFVSRNGDAPVITYDWPGRISSAVVDPRLNIVSAAFDTFDAAQNDVFVQKGSAQPQLVTVSAPLQTDVALAAGSNGFLAAWIEVSESGERLLARRFSQFGQPQGDVREVTNTTATQRQNGVRPQIVFADDAYLIVWGSVGRRLDARTGDWLDAATFAVPSVVALASSGREALALVPELCSQAPGSCLAAQPIAMRGSALAAPPVLLLPPASGTSFSLASSGTDYLMIWSDALACPIPEGCGGPPPRILASRLRADGTRIDSAPLVLSSNGNGKPSAAWNGSNWVVAWSGAAGDVVAASVSAEGAVGAAKEVVPAPAGAVVADIAAIRWANDVVIVTTEVALGETTIATVVGGETSTIRSVPSPGLPFGPVAAAANGAVLMFAYDRIDATSGHVDRVFLDPRVLVSRRRIAR